MENKKRRAGRNIKIEVTEDIAHTGLSEEKYKIIEEYYDKELVKEEKKEDEELSKKFESRLDLSEEEWVELPPGKSAVDYYLKNKRVNKERVEPCEANRLPDKS